MGYSAEQKLALHKLLLPVMPFCAMCGKHDHTITDIHFGVNYALPRDFMAHPPGDASIDDRLVKGEMVTLAYTCNCICKDAPFEGECSMPIEQFTHILVHKTVITMGAMRYLQSGDLEASVEVANAASNLEEVLLRTFGMAPNKTADELRKKMQDNVSQMHTKRKDLH